MTVLGSYEPSDEEDIPATQGVYAFYIDPFSREKFGLLGKGPFTTEHLTNARNRLSKKTAQLIQVCNHRDLTGVIKEQLKSPVVSHDYKARLTRSFSHNIGAEIDQMPLESVPGLLDILAASPMFTQPIYVGMTKAQTLRQRYQQHRVDYESEAANNNFGGRLRKAKVPWNETRFFCRTFSSAEEDASVIRIAERILQAAATPALGQS